MVPQGVLLSLFHQIESQCRQKYVLSPHQCMLDLGVTCGIGIQFSTAFIGEEIGLSSSAASGLCSESGILEKAYWLVEPKRPSAVTKFSGTLSHQMNRNDLQSLTISAFAHFVYLKSKGTRVFADIQGTKSLFRNYLILYWESLTHQRRYCHQCQREGYYGFI